MIILTLFGIYSDNSNYASIKVDTAILNTDFNGMSASVIGVIEIKKIDIIYPILSSISKDFLKTSPCRFYGPNPNEVGNLCIAGHNYKNDSFFSNISKLVNGNIITIYDLNGTYIDYIVYDVYTSAADNLECTSQDTNGTRIVTLITCDSINNNYRTIVKAKEI